jgi:hypothetical protein|tara:strand:+ start:989 stop:1090 length:102 start_codon:yes stop_codon:yes gene_type:complete
MEKEIKKETSAMEILTGVILQLTLQMIFLMMWL